MVRKLFLLVVALSAWVTVGFLSYKFFVVFKAWIASGQPPLQ